MSADANPQIQIDVNLNANTAAGASQAVGDVDRVGSATVQANRSVASSSEDTKEKAEALNETMRAQQEWMMRNAFYVHRLAEGFKDLSMGGRAAGQGLMDISESLQYMLGPEVAIYAAMAQVVAMLAMVVTSHHNRREAAKEASEAEQSAAKAATEAFDRQVASYKEGISAMVDGQGALLKSQQESTSEIGKQADMLKANAEMDKQAALLKLQEGYTEAMALTTSEDERKTIERRYNAAKADIEGQSSVNIANLEAQEAASKAKAAADRVQQQKQDYEANLKKVEDAQQQKTQAEDVFTKYGVVAPRNEKGELTGALSSQAEGAAGIPFTGKAASSDVVGDLTDKIENLTLKIAGLEGQANLPIPTMWRLHEPQAQREKDWQENRAEYRQTYQIDDLKKQLDGMQTEREALQNALKDAADAQAVLGDTGLQKKIHEAPGELFQTNADAGSAQDEADQKARAAQIAKQKDQQDAQQRKAEQDQADQDARQQALRKWRDNELEAQKLRIQAQLETAPDGQKAGLEKQMASLKDQEEINKANDKLNVPVQPPAPPANPYSTRIDFLNNRLGQLQDQQQHNPDAAKYIDSIIQQVVKELEDASSKSDKWQQGQSAAGPLPSPKGLARQSIRDLTAAQINYSGAQATAKGDAAGKKEDEAADRQLAEKVQETIGAIQATGNKPMIAAMHQIIDLFKGKKDEDSLVAELAQLIAVQAATIQGHIQTQAQFNVKAASAIYSLQKEQSAFAAKINGKLFHLKNTFVS